jgi:hypothetical protein
MRLELFHFWLHVHRFIRNDCWYTKGCGGCENCQGGKRKKIKLPVENQSNMQRGGAEHGHMKSSEEAKNEEDDESTAAIADFLVSGPKVDQLVTTQELQQHLIMVEESINTINGYIIDMANDGSSPPNRLTGRRHQLIQELKRLRKSITDRIAEKNVASQPMLRAGDWIRYEHKVTNIYTLFS